MLFESLLCFILHFMAAWGAGISRTDPASRDEKIWVRTHGFARSRVPGHKLLFAVKRPKLLIFYLGFDVYEPLRVR